MTCAVDHVPDPALPEPPGAYSLFGTDQYPSSAVGDQGPQLTDRQLAAAGAGCVFLRCDESGSFDCANGFRCDTARAEPTSSGCVPIACQELGRCSSDALICEPTSKQPRRALSDLHGCVAKNCEEGLACPMFSVCNFETPGDGNGCGYLRCDEPGGGCIDSKCDPEPKPLPSGVTPVPNGLGCIPRHCALDGVACPAGYTCAPEDPQSGSNGCVWVATGSAGTGASAGAGGTSGSGGAGGLGQSGGPDAVTTGSGGVAGTPGAAGAPFRGMCR